MRKLITKRKAMKRIERKMMEYEMELHDLDSQHSRAYHTGLIDGLGEALFFLSPKRARRNPISIVWFDEDYDKPIPYEIIRETVFDAENSNLFQTVEAQ